MTCLLASGSEACGAQNEAQRKDPMTTYALVNSYQPRMQGYDANTTASKLRHFLQPSTVQVLDWGFNQSSNPSEPLAGRLVMKT
jgi:hypothetical protein